MDLRRLVYDRIESRRSELFLEGADSYFRCRAYYDWPDLVNKMSDKLQFVDKLTLGDLSVNRILPRLSYSSKLPPRSQKTEKILIA